MKRNKHSNKTKGTTNEAAGLRKKPRPTKSVGLPAVFSGLQHLRRYTRSGDAWRVLQKLNQKEGIDCPGCAWPDPDDDRATWREYCENGLKAIAEEAQSRCIDADFFTAHSIPALRSMSDFELGKLGRLAEPLIRRAGSEHYERITWPAAFDLVAHDLHQLASPDEAVFYTSGRTSNEAAFLYQLFARVFGTNNLPDCSNMCHESSGKALTETLGIGKGSVTLEDLHHAELIMVMGQNPGTNHPRMLSALERCKENGGEIITVNPLPEAGMTTFVNPQRISKLVTGGTKLTDLFVPIRINGDVAFLKAVLCILKAYESETPGRVFDLDFIRNKTEGFEALMDHLDGQDIDALCGQAGLPRATIEAVADRLRRRSKIIVCWAMGLTQHLNAVDNIREIVNVLLLKGAIGKPGAGTCPVRGHSNVQGDRTVGIWEAPSQTFLDSIERIFQFRPPQHHGFSVVDAIRAMHDGRAKVFVALGGNFLSAAPDTQFTAEALENTDLTVHVSTKLNRSHLHTGKQSLILPCLGRTEKDISVKGEQFVSCENSMGVVHMSKGTLRPCSPHLRSEAYIVASVAQATLGAENPVNWSAWSSDYDQIRDAIEATIPGFEKYNARVRQPAGFYLPNGARAGTFATPSGRAKFTINACADWDLQADEFLMMTIRSHDQFNTTIYGLNDRYRGIYNARRVILLNENDMANGGWNEGDIVNIHSDYEGTRRSVYGFVVIAYPIPPSCAATYFPEANALVAVDDYARISKTPCSKSVVITLESTGTSIPVG